MIEKYGLDHAPEYPKHRYVALPVKDRKKLAQKLKAQTAEQAEGSRPSNAAQFVSMEEEIEAIATPIEREGELGKRH
jgi:hypothetical protein